MNDQRKVYHMEMRTQLHHTMITLHPLPNVDFDCFNCGERLEVHGWKITGIRNLADLTCAKCGQEYYADLPTGHGLLYPAILNKESGFVQQNDKNWFGSNLRYSFENKVEQEIQIKVTKQGDISNPLLLNVIDMNYGHIINKLLNAQYYLDKLPEFDVIVLVPQTLKWMVPDGVSEIWTVEIPISNGNEWFESIDKKVKGMLESYDTVQISVTYPHPHPRDYNIERFTGIQPFPIQEWERRLEEPTVTFIWRDITTSSSAIRAWCSDPRYGSIEKRLRGYLNILSEKLLDYQQFAISEQRKNIINTSRFLRDRLSNVNVAVAGVGSDISFPKWINNSVVESPSAIEEKDLCKLYSNSHVVVGIHGSNMLLPSAHSGATLELIPPTKTSNILGDFILKERDIRESLFLNRNIPSTLSNQEIAHEIIQILLEWPQRRLRLQRKFSDHERVNENVNHLREMEANRVKIKSDLVQNNSKVDISDLFQKLRDLTNS